MISDELFPNEQSLQKKDKTENKIDSTRKISVLDADSTTSVTVSSTEEPTRKTPSPKPKEHTRIIFDLNDKVKKKSVLERLGKRQAENDDEIDFRTGDKKLKLTPIENKKDEHRISMMKRKMVADKQNTIRSKANEKKKYDWNKNEKQKADEVELEKREVNNYNCKVYRKVTKTKNFFSF